MPIWECDVNHVFKNFEFFFVKNNVFLMFSDRFDMLILKIKKYYFNILLNKKYFKSQLLLHSHIDLSFEPQITKSYKL